MTHLRPASNVQINILILPSKYGISDMCKDKAIIEETRNALLTILFSFVLILRQDFKIIKKTKDDKVKADKEP